MIWRAIEKNNLSRRCRLLDQTINKVRETTQELRGKMESENVLRDEFERSQRRQK